MDKIYEKLMFKTLSPNARLQESDTTGGPNNVIKDGDLVIAFEAGLVLKTKDFGIVLVGHINDNAGWCDCCSFGSGEILAYAHLTELL